MASKQPDSETAKRPAPWYAKGVRFECQADCGACCTNHEEYSYVYLVGSDLQRLAEFLQLSRRQFLRRFATREDDQLMLKMDQPACSFLDGARCTVYPARPVQCRTFPFWEENLRSRSEWLRLREFCPGIGKGEFRGLLEIEECVEERRAPE